MGGTIDEHLQNEEEEEARQLLLARIDANGDDKISFDEFLILFEGKLSTRLAIFYTHHRLLKPNLLLNLRAATINKSLNNNIIRIFFLLPQRNSVVAWLLTTRRRSLRSSIRTIRAT
jgi:hypothetical protein